MRTRRARWSVGPWLGLLGGVIVSPISALTLVSEGFDAGIPGGWTVVNNAPGNPVVWSDLAGCGEGGNYTGGAGNAACASSDLQGGGSGLYDTELWTPVLDLSGLASASVSYRASYQNFAFGDFLDLDISTNGGGSWTNLLSWNEDHGTFRATPGEDVLVDLAGFLVADVVLRWHYYDPIGPDVSQDWFAQIDDVVVSGTAVPEPGSAVLLGLGLALLAAARREAGAS